MGVINIVKSYPEIFGERSGEIDEDEAWRIIASAQSCGSGTRKIYFSIHDKFNVVCKLFELGLRESAAAVALTVLKYTVKQQHYFISQQLCGLLVRDYYFDEDIDSVRKYDALYRSYTNLIELEYQSQLIYGDLIYKYEIGVEYNELEIIRCLQLIEEKLTSESLIYHYYYHSFQLMISADSEYEAKLQNTISYFENQYYDCSNYLSSFVLKLVQHYSDDENYLQAEVLLDKHINQCKEGSILWFKYLKIACLFYLSIDDIKKANIHINKSFNCVEYFNLCEDVKEEWNQINSEIQAMN